MFHAGGPRAARFFCQNCRMDQTAPRIRFLIGGAQKAGTTALARLLAQHPGIALPDRLPEGRVAPPGDMGAAWCKEAHVFDAPDYDERWSPAEVDARFAVRFTRLDDARLHGDATPVSMYHPRVVERVRQYNPAMRWIVLLRDPVERAISHYFMERARGAEALPLLRALLAEPGRLHGSFDDMSPTAAWRRASYVDRGRYGLQLDRLTRMFPADQVLLLRSRDLASDPRASLRRVLAFLGVADADLRPAGSPVLRGDYAPPPPHAPARWWLRWKLRGEKPRLRARYGVDLDAP